MIVKLPLCLVGLAILVRLDAKQGTVQGITVIRRKRSRQAYSNSGDDDLMMDDCKECAYNIDNYCIMFDDILGYEDCIFIKTNEKAEGE